MPIITAIKPQKNGKRVNVYLDGKFGFGVDLQTFLKEGIKVEQELTEEQIGTIVKMGQFQDAYDKILMFSSLRPRSNNEYHLWLKKHKIHPSLYDELFNRLKYLQLLDDKRFAVWWVQQRQEFRPKSKRVLVQELKAKGIDQEIIEEVFSEEKVDEKLSAKKMLSKKLPLWNKLDPFEKHKKIFSFLAQRGFDYEIIRKILEELKED